MGGGDWRSQGLCARVQDVDAAWVPADKGTHRTQRQVFNAVKICDACPVRSDCLAHAMVYAATDDFATYGGLTRIQRMLLARLMTADGVPMRRVKAGAEQRFRRCKAWIQAHPDALHKVREESKKYWSRYYSHMRKKQQADENYDQSLYLQPLLEIFQ